MHNKGDINLGRLLKQRRLMRQMTLRELTGISGISSSHLARIEKGQRFPSASVLRKLAGPLGFEESELFSLAGYLSQRPSGVEEGRADYGQHLDTYVVQMLSQEPVEVQRTVIGILSILKNVAISLIKRERDM
jgi:transcriptional regulator with XRE-family HTH domain